ncbi:hypothetical protein T05_4558 [Trichinella murrelli]|uniref:Uncharacterized protein n=1 Tax=Trichinella murrelli TaxID=144512 RepID=A0A0V0TPR5_9BILA|nr:hypothetical protein T05_4558 [Trichinella murrelli]
MTSQVASAIPVAFLPALSLRNLLVPALVETKVESLPLLVNSAFPFHLQRSYVLVVTNVSISQCGAFTACSQSAQRLWPVELAECPWTPAFFQSYPDLPGCINNVVGLNVFASATLDAHGRREPYAVELMTAVFKSPDAIPLNR